MLTPVRHLVPPWIQMSIFLVLLSFVQLSSAVISKGSLPLDMQECYNRYSRYGLREVVGRSMCWACEAPSVAQIHASLRPSGSPQYERYATDLMYKLDHEIPHNRVKRQAGGCMRREYRMLTDRERNRLHRAFNILKRSGRYDRIARIHSGRNIALAHGGPNFAGWHREYLKHIERALQSIDSSICLVYWDSRIESRLGGDAQNSAVFGTDFFGWVNNGPFADPIPGIGPLVRTLGRGQLFSDTAVRNILSQRRTRDILGVDANPANTLENPHNDVHIYIGGLMEEFDTAAYDPIFFLHHCFVDYVWEQARRRGMTEYPEDDMLSPLHGRNAPLGFPGLNMTTSQAYIGSQNYDESPTCSGPNPTCTNSRHLRCVDGRCTSFVLPRRPFDLSNGPFDLSNRPFGLSNEPFDLPRRRPFDLPNGPFDLSNGPFVLPRRRKRAVGPSQKDYSTINIHPAPTTEILNTFCCNGKCDMKEWVYITVKVVSEGAPYLQASKNNGNGLNKNSYHPSGNGNLKCYENCNDENGERQIVIQSQGLSYSGIYKKSVFIHQELATSPVVAYLAVKDPKYGPVKTIFRAADSCGRICKTLFKTPGSERYEPFSGVLDIADLPGLPKQYSKTYSKATLYTWRYSSNPHFTSFRDDDISVMFYCDYSEEIPWADKTSLSLRRQTDIASNSLPVKEPSGCRIDHGCVINAPCNILQNDPFCYGEKYLCQGTCNRYVVCDMGHFLQRTCPNRWSFDPRSGLCTPFGVCETHNPPVPRQSAVPRW